MIPIDVDNEYFNLLNKALSMEIQAIIQYMAQHSKTEMLKMRKKIGALQVILGKNKFEVISDKFKEIALQEMDHAEKIAERIAILGGEPTTKSLPPEVGNKYNEFLKNNLKAEASAMKFYREIINEATKRGDITTKKLFEDIYMEEEQHYWTFDEYHED
ncbi:MAG: ferritin-like domain-containing protein [Candidatus Helarchaeota archaeon]